MTLRWLKTAGWDLSWYVPLAAFVLLWVFPFGLRYSLNDFRQLSREFTWGLFFSPAADLCISTELFFMFLPVLWFISTMHAFDGELFRHRYVYCLLLTVGLFGVLFVCQFVIDQSWPFLVDDQSAERLRMIPFLSFGMHTTRPAHL